MVPVGADISQVQRKRGRQAVLRVDVPLLKVRNSVRGAGYTVRKFGGWRAWGEAQRRGRKRFLQRRQIVARVRIAKPLSKWRQCEQRGTRSVSTIRGRLVEPTIPTADGNMTQQASRLPRKTNPGSK